MGDDIGFKEGKSKGSYCSGCYGVLFYCDFVCEIDGSGICVYYVSYFVCFQ